MTKSGRDTRTGGVLEQMLVASLSYGGYAFKGPVDIGMRPHGLKHRVDKLVTLPDAKKILISAKWQQTPGTVEEKVPYEVICLADAVRKSGGEFARAYLVIGGNGWRPKIKEWYLSGGLKEFLDCDPDVEILTLERFVEKANARRL